MTLILPSHSHDIQHCEILVHVTKQNLKRKAVVSDASNRDAVLDSTGHLRDEEIAKLGYKPSSLARMACKARALRATQMLGIHGVFDEHWHLPLIGSL